MRRVKSLTGFGFAVLCMVALTSVVSAQTPAANAARRAAQASQSANGGQPAAASTPGPAGGAQVAMAPGTAVEVKMMDAVDSGSDPAGKQYRALVTKQVNVGGNVTVAQGAAQW